jgi:hypothetical protein
MLVGERGKTASTVATQHSAEPGSGLFIEKRDAMSKMAPAIRRQLERSPVPASLRLFLLKGATT